APTETATRSAGKSTQGSKSRQMSASESVTVEELMQTTFEIEEPSHPEFETATHKSIQLWLSKLAKQSDSRSSFNELMDTPVDFFAFLMNRLRVDTLTPELLFGPTYELMKGSCKSLVELEYQLEEVYKATTDQLDWVNPEGHIYPHNLLKPLPLIPNNRGHRVISFIISSTTTSSIFVEVPQAASILLLSPRRRQQITDTSIKELFAFNVSLRMFTRSIVIQRRVEDLQLGVESYQKKLNLTKSNTYCSDLKRKVATMTSSIFGEGRKRQQFYEFAVNRESALDVYSKRRIIAVTNLKIVEWHNYKHLDWISVRLDNDKIYKFKEGDFKRLHLQDIADMLLLLVQGKLSNLTVKERFAFNVSLRMFTRSIIIQRRVEHMAWQTDYCIMKEGMPILRGRKSIPGMNSSEREMGRGYYSAFISYFMHVVLIRGVDVYSDFPMVNTRTDAELAAAIQNALQTLLPQIRAEIREEFRTSSGPSDSGGNPPPVTIHTWLERFNKQKPRSFEKATAPVDAENWISHMEKIFNVIGCEDAFKTRLVVYKFEGDALAW
nr:zinc finger, CCHC-type, retrotransposon Gag domain protein [Tanacetum cinerariifolium]